MRSMDGWGQALDWHEQGDALDYASGIVCLDDGEMVVVLLWDLCMISSQRLNTSIVAGSDIFLVQ